MKKTYLILAICYLFFQVSAQEENIALQTEEHSKTNPLLFSYSSPSAFVNPFSGNWNTDSTLNRFELDAGFEGNSNGISQQFLWNILFANDFNSKVKDKIRNQMQQRNGYEDNQIAGLRYKRYFKKFDGYFTAGYHFRTMRTAFINKEVYELVFYGNAMFENDTVDLSRLSFQNLIYNQFSLGFLKNFTKGNNTISVGLNASFLQGLNSQTLFFQDGSNLYTAPDGEFINLNYNMVYNQARFGNKREREKADVGITADFHLSYQLKNKFKLAFSIVDFGVINWRTQPQNYVGNKAVTFKGIEFADITEVANGSFNNVNIDSVLKSFLPEKRSDLYQTFIPFTMSLVGSANVWKDKLVLHAGLQYKPLFRYYVYGFVKANYFIQPTLVTSLTMGYGGYSKFNLGVEVAKHWKHFDLAVGTNNLIGTVAPAAYTGSSAYLRLGVNF